MKKYFLLFLFLSLASCGLRPIYQIDNKISDKSQAYRQELASIKVDIARKRLNQNLKNNLEKILNPDDIKTDPKYLISVTLKKSLTSTFTNFTGSSGRDKVILTASYKLKDLNSGDVIAGATTTAQDDFDVRDKRFANYAAEDAISENLTLIIAKNIRDLLINDIVNNYKAKDVDKDKITNKDKQKRALY